MTSKSIKWLLWAGVVAVLLAGTAAMITAFVLPAYVESRLIPRLADAFGLAPGDAEVRRISLWGADLGPIRFGSGSTPDIDITTIQVDYSPWSLVNGEIEGIVLGGIRLSATLAEKRVTVAGLKLPTAPQPPKTKRGTMDLKTVLPIRLGRLSVLNACLDVDWNNRRLAIPFEIRLQTAQLAEGKLKGKADLRMLGNPITVSASLDQSAQTGRVVFESRGILLESLYQLGLIPEALKASGSADVDGWASFGLNPFSLSGLSLSAVFQNTHVSMSDLMIQNPAPTPGKPQPIALSVSADSLSEIQWRCAPFHLSSPVKMTVKQLQGQWRNATEGWSLESHIESVIPRQMLFGRINLKDGVGMEWRAAAHTGSANQQIEFELHGRGAETWAASLGGHTISGEGSRIEMTGEHRNGVVKAKSEFSTDKIRIQLPDTMVNVPKFKLNSDIALHPPGTGTASSFSAVAELPKVSATLGTATMQIPEIHLTTSGRAEPNRPWHLNARFKLLHGAIRDPKKLLRIKNLSIDLPAQWPLTADARPGTFKIQAIEWNRRQAGGMNGTLEQHRSGLKMALHHTSKLFPGLNVYISGDIGAAGANVGMKIPPFEPDDDIDLGRFHPSGSGMLVHGRVKANGALTIDKTGTRANARFSFDQGRLRQETQNLLLDGIDMTVHLEDALALKSAPKQKLTVARLAVGSLAAQNLDVDFQLERNQTIFIEKASIEWAEGKINTSAIRIIPGKADYDVILFCDRLNLATVLEQLGAAQASGGGTVNGRIPIRWNNGQLSFDNGFLYSTPGQTGTIQLSGTEALLSGLPPGTPQHTQLDIATEALKDYTYKWTKLNVQSEDDILLLKLQFDGKPNRLLPFAYDQSLGQFKRVSGEGQADFKGIAIDLNFRSPLNDILNYKDLLKQQ